MEYQQDSFDFAFKKPCSNCQGEWVQEKFPSGNNIQTRAVFIDNNNTFEYGISGQYKLISEKIFQENDCLCNTCLEGMKYEEYLGVTCPYCKKAYQSLDDDDMGTGCSATIWK